MAIGFSQTQHGGQFPDIAVLDRITGNRPLCIRHNSGHMAVVNTAALRLAGAESPSFPDPDGGVKYGSERLTIDPMIPPNSLSIGVLNVARSFRGIWSEQSHLGCWSRAQRPVPIRSCAQLTTADKSSP